ncbi:MAG: hypothetical protein LBD76_00975 [Prevotellaceae bacterium]|jgi:hypothetical protein|nr:hypothetical protein [Prevotellaceae bacterium]
MDSGTIVTLLKDLIMEYNRVSLPCLGSFLSEYSPAVIADGKIYPPSKSVVFHQNEIWNDEKLENRIAQVNKVSIGVAKEELAFWIDNICVLLATGEEVLLPELGRLYVSKQAKLMFKQESENLLIESFGLEPVDIQVNGLIDNELYEFIVAEEEKKNHEKEKKSETRGLTIGVLIIALFAVASIFAIFWYIFTDKQRIPVSAIPVKTSDTVLKYEEYFAPKYGIVLSSFEKLGEARDFSKTISGTSIYCIDSETPYSVIFSYPSLKSSNNAIDSLKKIYSSAHIIELKDTK